MIKNAIFAGGCFWCMVKPFQYYNGVIKVLSGYIGGETEQPTYKEVCGGDTGHYEAIKIEYDDSIIRYTDLLNIFWKQIDPFDSEGQFADRGTQYRTAIFYLDDEQRRLAQESILNLERQYNKKIATKLLDAGEFYEAEEYHQDYHKKNINHYNIYYKQSGRYNFVKGLDRNNHNRDELKEKLSDISFEVTQNDMTEIPYENEYYNNFEKGIYVDIVDGTPLFTSKDKIKSDCGWPSFSKPIDESKIHNRTDYSFGMIRTEVRSLEANSHLGHVFYNEPNNPEKSRYCINSASLKFIPYDKMDEEGYGNLKKLLD